MCIRDRFLLCPPPKAFAQLVLDGETYRGLSQRLVPRDSWFAGLLNQVPPYRPSGR